MTTTMNIETTERAARQSEIRASIAAEQAATRRANAAAIATLPMTAGAMRAEIRGEWVVFTGGSRGEHRLDLLVTDTARAWAHWHGYCAANGVTVPEAMPVAPTAPASVPGSWS